MNATPEAAAQARRYIRSVTGAGGLLLAPNSTFVKAALDWLELARIENTLQSCDHVLDDRGRGLSFLPTGGPHAGRIVCLLCFEDPPRSWGCQVCDRTPAPGLRKLVAGHPSHGLVIVGQLCRYCRQGRV